MLKKIASKKYKETIFSTTLPNGLRVYLMPKAGFAKTYGLFVTNYGSLDNEFIPLDGQEFKKVPAGIAHFLEHKVFELEGDKDASNLFAQLGADATAYTSFTETAYLFPLLPMSWKQPNFCLILCKTRISPKKASKRKSGLSNRN